MEKLESSKKELIKHTSAIHCSNAMSLLQRKISNVLLYHAYNHLLEREEHKISIKELCRYLGYQGHNHEVIKQALRALISTVIEWNLTDDNTGEENWTASSILASVNIKNAICTYAYSPRMKELLFSPSMYGKINLLIQSQFTSSYSLALYENCVRYRGLEYTKSFPIDAFRKMMGVSESQYPIFRDFKRRVINKAVAEINSLTDLFIEPELKRIGRKVANIKFKIKERNKRKKLSVNEIQDNISEIEQQGDTNIVNKLIKNYQVKEKIAINLVEKYGEKRLEDTMVKIESSNSFLSGSIKNLGGYLINFLSKDYSIVSSAELTQMSRRKVDEEKEKKQKEDKVRDERNKRYSKYKNHIICNSYLKLEEKEKDLIKKAFLNELNEQKNTIILNRARNHEITEGIIQPFFCQFLLKNYSSIIQKILSEEVFFSEEYQ